MINKTTADQVEWLRAHAYVNDLANERFAGMGSHGVTAKCCREIADHLEAMEKELIDERYRHDRLQDFCVAQGEELSALKEDLKAIVCGNECYVCAYKRKLDAKHCNHCKYEYTAFKWRGVQTPQLPKEESNES